MGKYYVQCDTKQAILDSTGPREAAISFLRTCTGSELLQHLIYVNETGFDFKSSTNLLFETADLLNEISQETV